MAYTKPSNINSLWAASGTKVAPDSTKRSLGWIAEKPSWQYFNSILNRTDIFNAYVNERGIVEWDSGTEYQAGKSYIVGSDGHLYKCLVTGAGEDPTLDDGTNWQLILSGDGVAGWSAVISYPEGAVVLYSDGDLYEATTTTTAGSTPGVSSDWWAYERNGDLRTLIDASVSDIATNTSSITDLDDNKLDASGIQSVTGTATFTNSTNNINLTGIGIGREIGDVIGIDGSTNNDKLFTIEFINDDDNVIVNYEHRGGTYKKSLVDETATVTCSLVCKWYLARLGLGQGWCQPASTRVTATENDNDTNRTIECRFTTVDSGGARDLLVDGYPVDYDDPVSSGIRTMKAIAPEGSTFEYTFATGATIWELR